MTKALDVTKEKKDAVKEATKDECMTTWEWVKHKYHERMNRKVSLGQPIGSDAPPPAPAGIEVVTVAVVLDGEVQEVLRMQDRMAALFLSEPQFVEVDPDTPRPTLGWTYADGAFTPPAEASE